MLSNREDKPGFEPGVKLHFGFQNQRHKPLDHLSVREAGLEPTTPGHEPGEIPISLPPSIKQQTHLRKALKHDICSENKDRTYATRIMIPLLYH